MIDQLPPAQDMPAGRQDARRAHLVTEMTTRRRRPARRLVIGGIATAGVTGGLATAMTAALVLAPTAEIGGNRPAAPASAAEILDRAATAATQKAPTPRPDQYVYSETEQFAQGADERGFILRSKGWASVSGKRINLVVDSANWKERQWTCEEAQRRNSTGKEPKTLPGFDPGRVPNDCKNGPAYRRDLPADATAMRKWLYRHASGGARPQDVEVFDFARETAGRAKLSPAARAALYKAAGTLPGVTVTQGTVTVAGHQGVAVGQTWHGVRSELVFEPGTYRFIGSREVVDYDASFKPDWGKRGPKDPKKAYYDRPVTRTVPAGTVLGYLVIVKLQVVDRIPASYLPGRS
ncbi:CU044_5270 family protein [Actinomadura barringtoniae]|uniref:CU044_5270 family protein n=1 Tax=Actinomadura barringtoniae TaxID=1427535 RepID=A0A939TGP0_9ACTN|nr:CU044_5270 family protein [Actinomadura barringtoniae]MBO2455605.1 CU044_5270 family protein [Actinomadura barringtoniae]